MFEAKLHVTSSPLLGDAAAALNVARTALLSLGFEISHDTKSELHARGPGLQSNRQPALLGASELRFRIEHSAVAAEATLGGAATMVAFLYLFPPGLALGLAAMSGLFGLGEWWISLLWVAPWLFLSPWMASSIERNTTKAVDRLVNGMAGATAHSA